METDIRNNLLKRLGPFKYASDQVLTEALVDRAISREWIS